jgi:hypothetical protein
MFDCREVATHLVEQGSLIERIEASFCDFTSLFASADEQRIV